jgi:hypothetical protein
MSEISSLFTKFKKCCNDSPEFFRQKEQYSLKEKLQFLYEFYSLYIRLLAIFEEREELKDGAHLTIPSNEHIDKTKLTKALLEQEYDICVSIIFYNLSKDEIAELISYAKSIFLMQQALIVEKIFEKFND